MSLDRVTIKRRTLLQLRDLVEKGETVTALKILRECLDVARTEELRRCKKVAYEGYKDGRWSYEEYRRLYEYADGFLR